MKYKPKPINMTPPKNSTEEDCGIYRDDLSVLALSISRLFLPKARFEVTIQALRGRQNLIGVEGAAQHFQHAVSLLAQRVQA